MILWCKKHVSFHCEGPEKCIYHALFMITNWNYVLWRLLILLISTHPFILSIYHISDFWSKIRFRIHIIIIQGQMDMDNGHGGHCNVFSIFNYILLYSKWGQVGHFSKHFHLNVGKAFISFGAFFSSFIPTRCYSFEREKVALSKLCEIRGDSSSILIMSPFPLFNIFGRGKGK